MLTSGSPAALSAFPDDSAPPIGDLLAFVEARAFFSADLPSGHWILAWRNALLILVAFLVEVRAWCHIDTERGLNSSRLQLPYLWGVVRAAAGPPNPHDEGPVDESSCIFVGEP